MTKKPKIENLGEAQTDGANFIQQSKIHQLPSPHLLAVMDRAWSYPPPSPTQPPQSPPQTSAVSSGVSRREEEGRQVRKARTERGSRSGVGVSKAGRAARSKV